MASCLLYQTRLLTMVPARRGSMLCQCLILWSTDGALIRTQGMFGWMLGKHSRCALQPVFGLPKWRPSEGFGLLQARPSRQDPGRLLDFAKGANVRAGTSCGRGLALVAHSATNSFCLRRGKLIKSLLMGPGCTGRLCRPRCWCRIASQSKLGCGWVRWMMLVALWSGCLLLATL
jgi:hypothetical protein